ncbi:JAB domain-containing protein [Pediococcus acidilactici]|uniref:JAB domain-containing protein n=1 Tax=Pediococcus acidilactici TaxID=1254 RepID=UPI0013277759|nr:DNA repair protein RadC [Pediococcus acidilactici]KAF0337077.1 DNA repair protein RadC [Pediococcus acidilactici]KAF0339378.1 DNA repair protein RadC [Pediococcus acidilactici]KAF0348852.1 DNA repair protein RadC [Pediococcus acidilactici]KAF0379602.1 DNA repair protein RadC [Pediococcus acidilactici]KAF0390412.1 DNA repair protein RadC [Pediococcus acidilactici]
MLLKDGAREKLTKIGAENLTNAELLRAFLSCCGQEQAVNRLSQEFWDQVGDIVGYSLLTQRERQTIFSQLPAESLALEVAIELGRRVQRQPIHLLGKVLGSAQIGNLMVARFQKNPREHLVLLCLDTKNQIKQERVIFKGGLNSAEVHPREIMAEVLRYSSNGFILVHNYPSGNVEPSMNDVAFTRKMKKIGDLMGIRLIDHLIVGDQTYWSAAENRVLNDC